MTEHERRATKKVNPAPAADNSDNTSAPTDSRRTKRTAPKPSRSVTRRRCVVCNKSFIPKRSDARYCSAACRQQAARSRAAGPDWQAELDRLRRAYWDTVRRAAEARGVVVGQIVTEQSQLVDPDGNVFIRDKFVGTTRPPQPPGWTQHGLEAAGPPFSPPTKWLADHYEGRLAALYDDTRQPKGRCKNQ